MLRYRFFLVTKMIKIKKIPWGLRLGDDLLFQNGSIPEKQIVQILNSRKVKDAAPVQDK